MTLIEGFGDEVTITLSIFMLLATIIVAWLSTRVSENILTGAQLGGLHVRINRMRQNDLAATRSDSDPSNHLEGEVDATLNSDGNIAANQETNNSLPERNLQELPQNNVNSDLVEDSSSASELNSSTQSAINESKTIQKEESNASLSVESVHTLPEEEADLFPVPDTPLDDTGVRRRRGEITSDSEPVTSGASSNDASVYASTHVETKSSQSIGDHSDTSQPRQAQELNLKIKFLNETERLVRAVSHDTVGEFKRVNFTAEAQEGRAVHLIFNGQFLREETRTLASYNVVTDCVLHCHISQNQQSPQQTTQQQEQPDLDLGQFMVPLFACTLGFVWYLRWQYHYMFNTMSTMSLVAVSVLFILAVLAAWRG